jgi:Glycosyl transferase family 2
MGTCSCSLSGWDCQSYWLELAMRCPNSELDNSPDRQSCANCSCELAVSGSGWRPLARLTIPSARTGPGQCLHKTREEVELSVVIPCLNEADTLADCIERAQRAIRRSQIAGEVCVADNGSTDGSLGIVQRLGARVGNVSARGYGNALMCGIAAALGKFINADGSYDFEQIPCLGEFESG